MAAHCQTLQQDAGRRRISILAVLLLLAWAGFDAPSRVRGEPGPAEDLARLLAEEVRLAQSLIDEFPESEEPLVLMGSVHSRRGNTDQALGFWDRALEKNPRRADVYAKMANVAFETDQLEKAIRLWRKVRELEPRAQGTHSAIAEALIHLGKYEDAIGEIREEIQAFGDTAANHFLLGQAYQHLRDYEKARRSYEAVVEFQPNHVKAVYSLYIVCARSKRSDEAKKHLALFKKLKAQETAAIRHADAAMMTDLECFYDALAGFCFDVQRFYPRTGKNEVARKVLETTVSLGQDNAAFLRRLAGLYVKSSRVAGALALYSRAAQLAPTDMSDQVNIGILSVKLQRFEQAETAFRKAIELAPDHYGGYQELARLYLRTKENLAEAKTLATKVVELRPQADAYYDLGLACLANNALDEALAAIGKAIELDPHNTTYARIHQLIEEKKAAP